MASYKLESLQSEKPKTPKTIGMPPERMSKRRGPKPKTVTERQLIRCDIRPIRYPERSYSQSQKLRVLVFLEHHTIPIARPGIENAQYRNPTLQEASDIYQIPRRTISDWVKKKERIEQIGRNSTVRKDRASEYSPRMLWPILEERLYPDFVERMGAGRTVRQGWFRIQS